MINDLIIWGFKHWEITMLNFNLGYFIEVCIFYIFYHVTVYQEIHNVCDSIKININNWIFHNFNLCSVKLGSLQVKRFKNKCRLR